MNGVITLIYHNCDNCKHNSVGVVGKHNGVEIVGINKRCNTCMFIEPGELFSKWKVSFEHWEPIDIFEEVLFEI